MYVFGFGRRASFLLLLLLFWCFFFVFFFFFFNFLPSSRLPEQKKTNRRYRAFKNQSPHPPQAVHARVENKAQKRFEIFNRNSEHSETKPSADGDRGKRDERDLEENSLNPVDENVEHRHHHRRYLVACSLLLLLLFSRRCEH
jgi:hypothetical protein